MDITVYTLEARNRADTPYPECDFWTYDYQEAKKRAQDTRLIVIANTYEWADSEPLDDYAPCDWAIVYNDTGDIGDRFATEAEAREAIAGEPGRFTVRHIPDTGVI